MKKFIVIFKNGEKMEILAVEIFVVIAIAQTRAILKNQDPEISEIID